MRHHAILSIFPPFFLIVMNRKLKLAELNRLSNQEFKGLQKAPIRIILDNIRSMNNVGSVFRTSDAFKIDKIFLCGVTATPPHRDIQKTALGATDSVSWQYFENTMDAVRSCKKDGYKVLSIEQAENSVFLNEFNAEKGEKIAIVMGNEVTGVDQEVINQSDFCIEIPQFGTKHSLNVSVCTGVVIWDIFNKVN